MKTFVEYLAESEIDKKIFDAKYKENMALFTKWFEKDKYDIDNLHIFASSCGKVTNNSKFYGRRSEASVKEISEFEGANKAYSDMMKIVSDWEKLHKDNGYRWRPFDLGDGTKIRFKADNKQEVVKVKDRNCQEITVDTKPTFYEDRAYYAGRISKCADDRNFNREVILHVYDANKKPVNLKSFKNYAEIYNIDGSWLTDMN